MKNISIKRLVIIIVVLFAITGFAFTVYGMQTGNSLFNNTEDQLKAEQIAQLAQIDTKTVYELYKAVGNWDKLFRNISIYKQLIFLTKGTKEEKNLFEMMPMYDPSDLYVAYDYFLTNELPLAG